MKQTIKLNESQLSQIVMETVKRVLSVVQEGSDPWASLEATSRPTPKRKSLKAIMNTVEKNKEKEKVAAARAAEKERAAAERAAQKANQRKE